MEEKAGTLQIKVLLIYNAGAVREGKGAEGSSEKRKGEEQWEKEGEGEGQ